MRSLQRQGNHRGWCSSSGACRRSCYQPQRAARLSMASTAAPAPATVEEVVEVVKEPARTIPFGTIKGILFDIDGTLTHSDPLHLITYADILQEVGFNNGERIGWDFFNEHISGRSNPEICRELFPDWPEAKQRWLYDTKEERFRAMAATTLKEVEGLTEFRNWAAGKKLRVAAVTNACRANAELMLSAIGLSDYFEVLVIGEECAHPKPDPEPYLVALRALGLQPHEAVIVEDSEAGITAGVAAGVPVVGLVTSQPSEKLLAAGARFVVADFTELVAVIKMEAEEEAAARAAVAAMHHQQDVDGAKADAAKAAEAAAVAAQAASFAGPAQAAAAAGVVAA